MQSPYSNAIVALNGAYLTWFDTYQYFIDSVPNVRNIQNAATGLDPGTSHAIWQLGSCEDLL